MAIIRSLFKAIKTTAQVTNAGLEQFNKGMDSINRSLEDLSKMQSIMQEAKIAYSVQKELIYLLDKTAELKIKSAKQAEERKAWLASMTPEEKERIKSLFSRDVFSDIFSDTIDLDENKRDNKPWPIMKRPVINDPVFQAKADLEFAELQKILEHEYSNIKLKCKRNTEFSQHFKKELIRANCPDFLIEKMVPNHNSSSFLNRLNVTAKNQLT